LWLHYPSHTTDFNFPQQILYKEKSPNSLDFSTLKLSVEEIPYGDETTHEASTTSSFIVVTVAVGLA
jgi:hypothetical protein